MPRDRLTSARKLPVADFIPPSLSGRVRPNESDRHRSYRLRRDSARGIIRAEPLRESLEYDLGEVEGDNPVRLVDDLADVQVGANAA